MARHILLLVRFIRHFPVKKLEYALDLYILTKEKQLAEATDLPPQDQQASTDQPPSLNTALFKKHYEEDELMTIKEAMDFIPISRSKLFDWRMEGKLHTIERNCRSKRLVRAEVEALRIWARNKGKW